MEKIVLIGAGSQNFGLGIISDIFKSKSLEGSEIFLHDIDKTTLANTKIISNDYKEKLGVNFDIKASISRKEALENATFCIISIEVGNRFDLWDQDWKIPLQYGIRQVYGENGGPGGLFHSLRQIPPIIEICEDINSICPNAVVFNFSNPMQRICHAVTTKFPDLKFIGMCHEIKSMQRQLPDLMETEMPNIEYRAAGLNHLSILLEARYKNTGEDGYPIINQNFDIYFSDLVNNHDAKPSKPGAERGIFRGLFKTYGYLPITTDSHLGEYIQWAYSIADHDAILDFYDSYKEKCLAFYDSKTSYDHYFDPKNPDTHERVIPIIEGILGDSGYEEPAINIPNNGYIACLPTDIVVEVPGIINKSGVSGISFKNYPTSFGSLLNLQTGVIQMTTDAVLNASKHSAYLALLADPVVNDSLQAEKLLNNMLETQGKFLYYLN
jgi:alpha-galactosidase